MGISGRMPKRLVGYDGVLPEALFREGMSRATFKILLELDRTLVILKAEMNHDLPRPVLRRMRRTSGIVRSKPCFEVLGHAYVALIRMCEALKEVNVLHEEVPPSQVARGASGDNLR